ncbi:MAG: glycosyltransferase family 4 protein [Vicinamibacterales bacterium]
MSGKPLRLAWFSPLLPVPSGVAAVSADLLPALAARGYTVDAYADVPPVAGPAQPISAHDFVWRHQRQPYDLVVYQLGNSSHHDYAWAYALRYPGLVVLHDTRLHHARAAHLLRERRAADYRAELAWSEPTAPDGIAELAIAGFDSAMYYQWPMVRSLVDASRLVAVHGACARAELIDALAEGDPAIDRTRLEDRIASIRLGHGEPVADERAAAARRRIRAQHGIPETAVVFGVFGSLTPEKRIARLLAAFSAVQSSTPGARLLLAGAATPTYDLEADIAARGLRSSVTLTGYIESDEELTDCIAACDVSVNLRWPTARETSGPWLRAMAAGRPTIVTDLVQLGDVPSLDPRTWTVNEFQPPTSNLQPPTSSLQPPICVAIDILDEDHSLQLALRRLASDVDLRCELGRAAAAWWRAEHSVVRMVDDYERVLRLAVSRSTAHPSRPLPAYMRGTGDQLMRALLEPYALGHDPLE